MTREWFENVGRSGLGWRVSKEATYDIAMLALQRGIPGDFVECGVYAGASVALMARAIMDKWEGNSGLEFGVIEGAMWSGPRVHLFDSFQGTPWPGPQDIGITEAGGASCPMADVQANMTRWGIPEELLVYHPGWFEHTILAWARARGLKSAEEIAVLRLDGDLYSSTKTCLQHLLPLVSPGGWVIVDDFDLPGCREAFTGIYSPAPIYFRVPEKL